MKKPKLENRKIIKKLNKINKRTVEVSLQTAREWYKSDNKALKEVALQVFSEEELTKSFRDIKNMGDAIKYLKSNKMCYDLIKEYNYAPRNSYTETLAAYRIVVAALTDNEKRKLTIGNCWFPVIQFCEIEKEKNCLGNKKIGTIMIDGKRYSVMSGHAYSSALDGIGAFHLNCRVSTSWTTIGFRSVSSKEIAQYISEQFGKLLFEVYYGGVNCDWEWID